MADGPVVKVNMSGVDALLRKFDRTINGVDAIMDEACDEAADYMVEQIKSKFPTMTPGHQPDTPWREMRRGGATPFAMLEENGEMKESIKKRTRNRTRRHAVNVISDSIKLIWHMYGVPRTNVPKRDPVRPTIKAERQKCLEMMEEVIEEGLEELLG